MVLLAVVVCAASSCRKIQAPAEGVPGETLTGATTLPAEWGRLVSVSSEATHPDLAQLWFQDDSGTVRMVVYRIGTGELVNVRIFRRQ
jgi:hypothetical protein